MMKTRRTFSSPLLINLGISETWGYTLFFQFACFFLCFCFVVCHLACGKISLTKLESTDVYLSQTLKIYDALRNQS